MTPRHGMLLLLMLTSLAATIAVAADEVAGPLLPVDENELLILEVRVDRYRASDGLIAYGHDGEILLPLGELAAALEFAILSYPELGLVEGWLSDENDIFRFDLDGGNVQAGDREFEIPAGSVYVNDFDVYVTSSVLSQWWPLDFVFDAAGMRMVGAPRAPVPLLERIERERQWSRFESKRGGRGKKYPERPAKYRMAAWPFLEAAAQISANEDQTNWSASLLSRGDLARLSVTGFASKDSRTGRDWSGWLRAGRTSRDGGLLGPLDATGFTIGDVTSESLPLVGGSNRGRGFTVTNRPPGVTAEFDAIDFRGDAPPGWQVELYVDGTLFSITSTGADGHYLFERVPLHVGLNTLRAVLYGPNGQQRERVQTYTIRSGMRRGGSLQYEVSTMQPGQPLFGDPTTSGSAGATDVWSHQADLRYGLSARTTLGASYSKTLVEGEDHQYVLARVMHSFGPLYLQAVGARDLDGGAAAQLAAQTYFGERSLYLNYVEYDGLVSPRTSQQPDLERQMSVRFSGYLGSSRNRLLNYRLKWDRNETGGEDPRTSNLYSLYLGGNAGSFSFGNDLAYQPLAGMDDLTVGQFYLANYLGGVRLRGQVNYSSVTSEAVDAIGATASYAFSPRLRGQLAATHSFLGEDTDSYQANLDWELAPVRLGLSAGLVNDVWNVGIGASTSLLRSPDGGGWTMSSKRLTRFGAALVRTFIDRDRDGAFGGGDQVLESVGFHGNQLWTDIRTAEDGRALLPGLLANRFTNVEIDYHTVDDPYLVPSHDGLTTIVHPGGIADLEFPFRYVGEIEGMVARDAEMNQPMRNIGLELVDDTGERSSSTVSEFDGYYLFQKVPPGEYEVRVVESTLRGRPLIVPDPETVIVPAEGGFVVGPTIVLRAEDDTVPPEPVIEPVEPLVVMVEPKPDESAAETSDAQTSTPVGPGAGDERERVAIGDDQVAVVIKPRPATSSPLVQVVLSAPSPGEGLAAPDERTLHLIYELLFDSRLFSVED